MSSSSTGGTSLPASGAERSSATVKGHFNQLAKQYTKDVVHGEAASTDPQLHALLRQLVVELEEFWRHVMAVGAFSANDDLDDYSTTALEMLWTPYMIGDIYQRFNGSGTPPAVVGPSSAQGARMPGREGEGRQDASASSSAYAAAKTVREEDLKNVSRQELLARSHEWFKVFFKWMENVELVDEKTIETYAVYRPTDRTQRIELARLRREAEGKWREYESKVQYMRVKRRRMQELMEESGEAMEEGGGEEEEALRERALARLRWSIYDACHQLQLSSRELEMLQSLNPQQRAAISEEYQRTFEAVRRGELSLGRHTYTILPGGMMVAGTLQQPVPVDADVIAKSGGVNSQVLSAAANQQQFRQQVHNDLMIDRNPPTLSLQEFAEMEMATMQRQMDEAAEQQRLQAEEDARLGPDGVEDRQRKKDSAWADWKDEHPAYGPSNKGNYS